MERKKRKWDVAAPAAAGAAGAATLPGRAGIGIGATVPAQYAGFVTGQVRNRLEPLVDVLQWVCLSKLLRRESQAAGHCITRGLCSNRNPRHRLRQPWQSRTSSLASRWGATSLRGLRPVPPWRWRRSTRYHPAVHGIGAGDMSVHISGDRLPDLRHAGSNRSTECHFEVDGGHAFLFACRTCCPGDCCRRERPRRWASAWPRRLRSCRSSARTLSSMMRHRTSGTYSRSARHRWGFHLPDSCKCGYAPSTGLHPTAFMGGPKYSADACTLESHGSHRSCVAL
jgi:hypothetical protein